MTNRRDLFGGDSVHRCDLRLGFEADSPGRQGPEAPTRLTESQPRR
jgi:hypothetical protein